LAHVYGFRPYFYVAAPSGFLNKDLDPLKDTLNVRFNHLLRRGNELISRV
jgi:ABC-type amino acid transport substrate-binding protein